MEIIVVSNYELELFYFPSCPFCQYVLDAIKGLKVELTFSNIMENPDKREELYNKTGRTTVPCLFINGKAMFESQDIITWLNQNFDSIY